jgi:type VI secretion system protein ImpA
MSNSRKQEVSKSSKAPAVSASAPAPHDWMTPIDASAPCGPDLEYDPEFVVLSARMAAKTDAQYGDFVGSPEPVNWTEVERDCRRLMIRSKDMRLAVLFARSRARLAASTGLAEGLGLLVEWLTAFPDTVHPQPGVDDDHEAALEIRMNVLQTLADTEGLLSDMREIALTRSTAARLQVRDVERAFAHPRPSDALPPESVTRQLEDLRMQQPEMLAGFDRALASLGSIDEWCKAHLGVYQPDLTALTRLLRRVVGEGARGVATLTVSEIDDVPPVDPDATAMSNDDVPARYCDVVQQTTTETGRPRVGVTVTGRDGAVEQIREARNWFEQHEPSSPISVLLRRAELLVGKRYAEVANAIPVELLVQWERE